MNFHLTVRELTTNTLITNGTVKVGPHIYPISSSGDVHFAITGTTRVVVDAIYPTHGSSGMAYNLTLGCQSEQEVWLGPSGGPSDGGGSD